MNGMLQIRIHNQYIVSSFVNPLYCGLQVSAVCVSSYVHVGHRFYALNMQTSQVFNVNEAVVCLESEVKNVYTTNRFSTTES